MNSIKSTEFKRANGISSEDGCGLRVENGKLKWNAQPNSNTTMRVTFPDENGSIKVLYISNISAGQYEKDGDGKAVVDGFGNYIYYYEITNKSFPLTPSEVGSHVFTSGIDYSIQACIVGNVGAGEIDSNYTRAILVNRLEQVKQDSIKTNNGILTWEAVDGAKEYIVRNGNQEVETTEETMIDLSSLLLPVNVNYNFTVQAIGTNELNALYENASQNLYQLAPVDAETIAIDGHKIKWDEVQFATGYCVKLEHDGEPFEDILENPEFDLSQVEIAGKYKFEVSAIGFGETNLLKSAPTIFESSGETPLGANSVQFNEENYRIEISVDEEDFSASDKLMIQYNIEIYKDSTLDQIEGTAVSKKEQITSIDQNGYYYYQLATVAKYTNIQVYVERAGVGISAMKSVDNCDLKLFKAGEGTETNPYLIANAQHLMNIKYFTSSHYELNGGIDMSQVVSLNTSSKGLICDEFSGMLDGGINKHAIYGFNRNESNKTDSINVSDNAEFALFGQLNGAVIKNLTIGQENYTLKLVNSFANNVPSVVKLSLIATGANNSTIENIKIPKLEIELSVSESNNITQTTSVYVAGLISEIENTTITDVEASISVYEELTQSDALTIYVGGLSANAENSNISNCNIKFKVESYNKLSYVGGAVARIVGTYVKNKDGTISLPYSISNVNVTATVEGVQLVRFGGIAGFAKHIEINNCETFGNYDLGDVVQQDVIYVGGLVGYSQGVHFNSCDSEMTINAVSNKTNSLYFGLVVGLAGKADDVASVIENCCVDSGKPNQTTFQDRDGEFSVIIGLYGLLSA